MVYSHLNTTNFKQHFFHMNAWSFPLTHQTLTKKKDAEYLQLMLFFSSLLDCPGNKLSLWCCVCVCKKISIVCTNTSWHSLLIDSELMNTNPFCYVSGYSTIFLPPATGTINRIALEHALKLILDLRTGLQQLLPRTIKHSGSVYRM